MIDNRYKIVIDIDGVLLDVVTPALTYIAVTKKEIIPYDSIITYDFNKSAVSGRKISSETRKLIYDFFETPECYNKCIPDLSAFSILIDYVNIIKEKNLSIDVILYSKCADEKASLTEYVPEKIKYIKSLLPDSVADYIEYSITTNDIKQAYAGTDVIIEDCIDNIKLYDNSVMRYLIQRPYNTPNPDAPCNTLPNNILYSHSFKYMPSTSTAIVSAFNYIFQWL